MKQNMKRLLTLALCAAAAVGVLTVGGPAARAEGESGSGLVLNKTVTAVSGEDRTYQVTLEAYATGSAFYAPAEIVLVLDESSAMTTRTFEYVEVYENQLDTNETYYIKSGNDYVAVKYCDEGYNGYQWSIGDGGIKGAGWYTGDHFDWEISSDFLKAPLHFGTQYKPLTDQDDDGMSSVGGNRPVPGGGSQQTQERVQFYKKDEVKNSSKLTALQNAAKTFVEKVQDQATKQNADYKISVIGYKDDATEVGTDAAALKIGPTSVNDNSGVTAVQNAIGTLDTESTSGIGMDGALTLANGQFTTNSNSQKVVVVFSAADIRDKATANNAIGAAKTLKGAGITIYTVGMMDCADPTLDITDSNIKWNSIDSADNRETVLTNARLQAVSSNFPNATACNSWGNDGSISSGYYRTAANEGSIADILDSIKGTFTQKGSSLGATAVLKDEIEKYFEYVDGSASAYAVNVSTSTRADGSYTPTVNNGVVSVTGFDYSTNWVGTNANGSQHGQKLTVTYKIRAKADFLGGNGVPTQTDASGVYASSAATAPMAKFTDVPQDVAIPELTVTAEDKNVYLLGGVSAEEMKKNATATAGGATLELDNSSNYGLAEWQNKFVNITVNATVSADAASNLTADTNYTVTCKITPKTTGSASEQTGTGTVNIYVYKPELSYPGYTVYLGGTVPTFTANSTVWKHGDDTASNMIGSEPTVTVTFNTSGLTNCTTIGTSTGNDTRISDVKIGETSVKDHVTIKDFTVHVKTPVVTANDQTIYLSNTATLSANVSSWAACGCSGTIPTVSGEVPTTMTFSYSTSSGTVSNPVTPTDCTTYTATLTSIGTATNLGNTYTGTCTVHVLKPTVTFQDTTIYLSQTANYNNNIASVTWACSNGETGTAGPTLSYEYSVSVAAFTECTGVSVSKVTINGMDYTDHVTLVSSTQANQTMLAALFSTRSADPHFTVHVLRPTLIFADSTIYLGNSAEFSQNYLSNQTAWSDQCGNGNTGSGSAPTVTPSYDKEASAFENCTAVKVNSVKIGSTDYSNFASLVTMKNGNSTLDADSAAFTVHVVKPVITNSDTTIYLGGTANLNDRMNEDENWICEHSGITLPKEESGERIAPVVTYSFKVGSDDVGTSYSPKACTVVTVTSTVGSFTVTPKENDNTFTVHVLVPKFTVTAQDLWADVDTEVDLFKANKGESEVDAVESCTPEWVYSSDCQGHDSAYPDGAPTVNVTDVLFKKGDTETSSETITEDDITVTVAGVKYKLSNGEAEYTTTGTSAVGTMAEGTVTSTLHANTFVLKITNTSGQNAIFDLKRGSDTLNQVAVPSGDEDDTTDVYGLYCGQDISYTLSEENGWSWRYSDAVEVTSGITHNNGTAVSTSNCDEEVEVTITYGTKTNDKWLSGQDCAINTATTSTSSISLQSLLNAIVPNKKEGEVAN